MSNETRAFGSPLRYIQGAKEFDHLPQYTKDYGRACCIIDGFLFEELSQRLTSMYGEKKEEFLAVRFQGECCEQEMDRICTLALEEGVDIFVGIGGGKTLDITKLCADRKGLPFMIVPTSASTDAPVSEIAVLYTSEGEYIGSRKVRSNADLVVADSEIIIKAPKRLFIAGVGDALATCFEARVCERTKAPNYIGEGYRCCKAGMAIAKECEKIIFEKGLAAIADLDTGIVTEAFEDVVEANILLSGLGFLNTGLAAAHGIHSGLTALKETHRYLHGEKVAFGIVCQLVLEEAKPETVEQTMRFMVKAGLPVTLDSLGVENTEENIYKIAKKTAEGPLVHHEERTVTLELLCSVIRKADCLGKTYIEKYALK